MIALIIVCALVACGIFFCEQRFARAPETTIAGGP